jgi:hypothetical protein
MRTWLISYNDKTCEPVLISAHEQQNTPTLNLSYNDIPFSVEFDNRSDYFASRGGTIAEVTVISASRKTRYKGTAVNTLKPNNHE